VAHCPGVASSASRCFAYDPLGRLTVAVNPEPKETDYSYDANGNVTQKTTQVATTPMTTTMTYTVGNETSAGCMWRRASAHRLSAPVAPGWCRAMQFVFPRLRP
jgi:YD repeat-containing protein